MLRLIRMVLVSLPLFSLGTLERQKENRAPAGRAAPVRISPAGVNAREPQLAVSKNGTVWVTYGEGSAIYCARSEDKGVTFKTPVKVGEAGKLSLGMRRGPRIAAAGKHIVISAVYGGQGGGRDGDLLAWHSEDGGFSWKGPVRVNAVPGAAREGLHGMAASDKDVIANVWLDLREKGTQIYASFSRDGGKTWGRNVRVYRSPSGTVCECCHPSAVFDSEGKLTVMWRNSLDGARDMYFASSGDGLTFSPAQKLGTGTWKLDACPMDGGALGIRRDNGVVTFWRREQEVFLCAPGKPETKIGDGIQGWLSMSGNTPGALWLALRGGALKAKRGTEKTRVLAQGADSPCVASLPGEPPRFLAVWQSPAENGTAIYETSF